jgi:sulfate transport system substrate-binding protein
VNFQFTSEAQKIWAEAGFRPADPKVLAEFTEKYPAPAKLWTIDDLGGWKKIDAELFNKDNGTITKIYQKATG